MPLRPEILMYEKDVFTLELSMAIYICDDIIYKSIFRDFALSLIINVIDTLTTKQLGGKI